MCFPSLPLLYKDIQIRIAFLLFIDANKDCKKYLPAHIQLSTVATAFLEKDVISKGFPPGESESDCERGCEFVEREEGDC